MSSPKTALALMYKKNPRLFSVYPPSSHHQDADTHCDDSLLHHIARMPTHTAMTPPYTNPTQTNFIKVRFFA